MNFLHDVVECRFSCLMCNENDIDDNLYACTSLNERQGKGKGRICPRTGQEGPEGSGVIAILFL